VIAQQLEAQRITHGETTIKSTARLMPATGTPQEVVGRTRMALGQLTTVDQHARVATAVALASMVQTDDAVAPAAQRFLAIRQELVRHQISPASVADGDALECMACPGTPGEVAGTVTQLIRQLAANREPRRDDVAVAVAFAKRFAY